MAVPRFIEVERNGGEALINIESIQSIEASDGLGVKITTIDGRTWYLEVGPEAMDKYGKIYAAERIIADAWYQTEECDDHEPLRSPYRDQVVATLIEGETIPVVVQNPGEFRD